MTPKEIISDYIVPAAVTICMSISTSIEGVLLNAISPMDIVIDEYIHLCTAISATLGVTYLAVKTYFLIKNAKEE